MGKPFMPRFPPYRRAVESDVCVALISGMRPCVLAARANIKTQLVGKHRVSARNGAKV